MRASLGNVTLIELPSPCTAVPGHTSFLNGPKEEAEGKEGASEGGKDHYDLRRELE